MEKGDYQQALDCLEDVLGRGPRVPPFRTIELAALRWAMDAWIGLAMYDDAIAMHGIPLEPAEFRTEPVLHIRLSLATAHQMKSKTTDDRARQAEHRMTAVTIAKEVYRDSNGRRDLQTSARKLLRELGLTAEDINAIVF